MKRILLFAFVAFFIVGTFMTVEAIQPPQDRGPGGPPGFGGPGGPPSRDLIAEFDNDEDGRLNTEERNAALVDIRTNPGNQSAGRRRGGPGRGGRGRSGPGGGGRGRGGPGGATVPTKPGRAVQPGDVEAFPDKSLYDETILRTVFIDFDFDTWEKDMGSLKDYGVDVPAKVTIDNQTYEGVGVRFRGNSSFFSVGEGQKRSLNLTFDWADRKQDLYGYRTVNLLNSHSDASFLRLVLYSHIAGNYVPTAKANYVHVVINGRSWGIYINEQQFNKDFTKEFFDSEGGRRWKSPPGRAGASFVYKGDDKEDYAGYELKSKDTEAAWADLIDATKTIAESSPEEIESVVDEKISIDRIMWFLAVDNVLLDMDGYYKRGADYLIYQEPEFGRFHILPYDNNETFRAQGGRGGPGFGGGPGGRGGRGGPPGFGGPGGFEIPGLGGPPPGGGFGGPGGPPDEGGAQSDPFDLDIFAGIDQPQAPFINKLMQNPAVKARYVAHVRTIRDAWIDWQKTEPLIEKYRDLIGDEIKKDTRKLTSFKSYQDGIGMSETQGRGESPGLKAFFKGRKAYLDNVPELKQPFSEFESVQASAGSVTRDGVTVEVTATLKKNKANVDRVFVYYADHPLAKFQRVEMSPSDGAYSAGLPPKDFGDTIYYYCEARTVDKYLTTAFHPELAEGKPASIKLSPRKAISPAVVINEIMAADNSSEATFEKKSGDWIELANVSNQTVNLTGSYLTDNHSKIRKWKFPRSATIEPGGFLIVQADGGSEGEGLHANFKLAYSGETVWLVDSDQNQNQILDELKFGKQEEGKSFGRTTDGNFTSQSPTPGAANQ